MLEHLARVKREGETAHGRGAEWVLVGLIASITNWIGLSVIRGHDLDLNANVSIVLHLSFVIFGVHRHPETVSVF